MKLSTISLNHNQYYSADDLKVLYKSYFIGTSRTTRLIITKKNISAENYIYAMKTTKNGWVEANETSKRAKLLLKKEFCDMQIISPPSTPKRIIKKTSSPISDTPKKEEEIKMAPPILYLDEEEMFKDADGNALPIEVRGEREEDKIFFYCKDVSDKFGISDLNKTILREHTSYVRNEDFILFGRVDNVHSQPIKTLFLTYQGLLKALFVSRNKNANSFRRWASKTLFTIQMGSQQEKDKLGAKIQNINYQDFANVFRKHANKLSAIYLIKIGNVKDIRKTFNIPQNYSDEQTLYKYGFTDDLNRRFKEHCKTFDKMENVKIDLNMFSYVDTKFVSQAEVRVKNVFEAYEKGFEYDNQKELVILTKKEEENAKDLFKMIARECAGSSEELTKKIQELNLQHKIEIMELQKENELNKKEINHLKEVHKMEKDNHSLEINNKNLQIKLLELEKQLLMKS